MGHTRRKRRWIKPLAITLGIGAVAVSVLVIVFVLTFSVAEF